MADHTLALLRDMRSEIAAGFQKVHTKLDEHGERLARIEMRLSSIEHTVGFLYAGAGDDRATLQALTRRVERIERRLELRDED